MYNILLWSSKVRKVSLPHYNFSHISYVRGWGVSSSQDSFNFFICCSVFQNTKYWPHSVRLWRDASPSKERRQRKSKAGRPRETDQGQGHRPLAYVKCVCLENKMVLVLWDINSKPEECVMRLQREYFQSGISLQAWSIPKDKRIGNICCMRKQFAERGINVFLYISLKYTFMGKECKRGDHCIATHIYVSE